jgi:hypothetical protein
MNAASGKLRDIYEAHRDLEQPAQEIKRHHAYWYHEAGAAERSATALFTALESDNQMKEYTRYIERELAVAHLATIGDIEYEDPNPLFRLLRPSSEKLPLHAPLESALVSPENINYIMDNRRREWLASFNTALKRIANDTMDASVRDVRMWLNDNIEMQSCFVTRADYKPLSATAKIRQTKQAKKAIKRGLRLFSNVLGADSVSLFLSGKEVTIKGEMYDYKIQKSRISVVKQTANPMGGHIPFKLAMTNKKGEMLCELCVYFKNTPMIDQIVALSLYIKHKEQEMLDTANFFNRTDAFWKDPVSADETPPPKRETPRGEMSPHESRRRFDELAEESRERNDKIDAVMHRIRPKLREVLPDTIGLDRNAFEFLMAPTFRFDQILEEDRLNVPIDSPVNRLDQLCNQLTG